MNWINTLLYREFKLFFSNKLVMAIFLGAPFLYGILTAHVYIKGKPDKLPVIIVNEDVSALSDQMIDAFEDNEYLAIYAIKNTHEHIEEIVKQNDIAAVITIPSHFESSIYQKKHPEINVDINTSNIVPANYASRGIQHVLGTFNAAIEIKALQKLGMPEKVSINNYEAFRVNYSRYYNQSANYMIFLWPGIIGTIIQQVFLIALALTFAREFEENTFGEMLKHTKSPFKIILIKTIPFLLLGLVVWFGLGMLYPIYKVPLHGNLMLLNLTGAIFILSIIAMGISVSILIPNQLKATEILMVIATPSFLISGFTWPLSQMPVWVQHIANCIPLTHFLQAYRKITLYEAGLEHIWPQLKILLILMLAFYLLSLVGIYWKIRKLKNQH